MKITILGVKTRNYTDKQTGELREVMDVYYSRPNPNDGNLIGVEVDKETISARSFPNQFADIIKAGDKILGKTAVISKDVRTFGSKVVPILSEFELLA